ncbi:MAG: hypothetical protein J6C42_02000, partial [Clostridia bacterium]|nr:hypothetical protein [Clostridia bacterium]
MEFTLNIRFADGATVSTACKILTDGNLTAVYANYTGDRVIDENDGGRIPLTLPGLESYMADNRYSEFWCRPAFGTADTLTDVPPETQHFLWRKTDAS